MPKKGSPLQPVPAQKTFWEGEETPTQQNIDGGLTINPTKKDHNQLFFKAPGFGDHGSEDDTHPITVACLD